MSPDDYDFTENTKEWMNIYVAWFNLITRNSTWSSVNGLPFFNPTWWSYLMLFADLSFRHHRRFRSFVYKIAYSLYVLIFREIPWFLQIVLLIFWSWQWWRWQWWWSWAYPNSNTVLRWAVSLHKIVCAGSQPSSYECIPDLCKFS